MKLLNSKNFKLLISFGKYCIFHPQERFWQALCNWSKHNFIYASDGDGYDDYSSLVDTYYLEGKKWKRR